VQEVSEYKLDLVGVLEVTWDMGGTKPAEKYTYFCGRGNENHELCIGFLSITIILTVKRVEFVNDRMSYIILRGRWCDVVLNVHAPTEDKIDDMKDRFYEKIECVLDKFPKYHMKICYDFSTKIDREDIFKPTIGNESLHEINNDNGVRGVNFATSKILAIESTVFPLYNIHKFTWTPPDEKTHYQIDHILIDRRRQLSILVVRSFRAAD
jgi:hypothetical protein